MKKGLVRGFITIMIASSMLLMSCGKAENMENSQSGEIETNEVDNSKLPIVTIKVKDYGEVKAELYPQYAPNTVNNFISLVNDGFYDGLIFHRVIKNFMIQGGDPLGKGTGGPGYSIKGEFKNNGFNNNTLEHTEGVLSMARSSSKNSAGSQFFIVTGDASHLDGDYAAFGKVIEGMDIVHKIESVKTNSNDKPINDVVIESIKVDTNGIDYNEPEKM